MATNGLSDAEKVFRRDKIGASDVAGALGVNPYSTPLRTYQVITGLEQVEETRKMRMGQLMEPVALKVASEEQGWRLIKPKTLAHPKYPWAIASPDSLIVRDKPNMTLLGLGKPADHAKLPQYYLGGVEVKNVGWHMRDGWGEPGTDEVPMHYLLQCMWGMAVTNLPVWHVVVMWDNQAPEYYTILRDDELIDMMLTQAGEYWAKYIDPQGPRLVPEASSLSEAAEAIKYRVRQTTGAYLAPDEVDRQLWAAWMEQSAIVDAEAAKLDDLKNTARLRSEHADGVEGLWRYKPNKDAPKTDYKAVVEALPKTDELAALVAAHTEIKPGARPLNPIKPKDKK